jgi:predicted ATP-dependent endonuclease of OLD family
MLRKFSVRNFRCLRKLEIEPLARVNLIVGENNVGKTALLEALFVHFNPGNPEAPLRVNHSRGVRGDQADIWEELEWLFHGKQTTATIKLLSKNAKEEKNALRIRLVEPEERLLVPTETDDAEQTNADMLATVAQSSVLKLEYTDHMGEVFPAQAYLTVGGISASLANMPQLDSVALVLKNPRFSEEHANRYSDLVKARREEELLPPLQALDPRIQRLELLFPANKPMLYVDIGSDQLVPLTYMGEGLGYVLSWQLAIMTANNGTVLIDEFENGLHYAALVDAWKAVGIAARQSSVQVFATTHSWECVLAAHRAFAESDEDDFRLHRLERRDGEVVALTYDQEQLDTAIEFNFEVR